MLRVTDLVFVADVDPLDRHLHRERRQSFHMESNNGFNCGFKPGLEISGGPVARGNQKFARATKTYYIVAQLQHTGNGLVARQESSGQPANNFNFEHCIL